MQRALIVAAQVDDGLDPEAVDRGQVVGCRFLMMRRPPQYAAAQSPAAFDAIAAIVAEIVDARQGQDALGEATVWLERDKQVFIGRGLSTDVVEASARAFVNAVNKMTAVCGLPSENQVAGGI